MEKVAKKFRLLLLESRMDSQEAPKKPWFFADTGLPLFLREACKLAGEEARIISKAAGVPRCREIRVISTQKGEMI